MSLICQCLTFRNSQKFENKYNETFIVVVFQGCINILYIKIQLSFIFHKKLVFKTAITLQLRAISDLFIYLFIKSKIDNEVLINNRHRTFPTTYGLLAIIDLYFVIYV